MFIDSEQAIGRCRSHPQDVHLSPRVTVGIFYQGNQLAPTRVAIRKIPITSENRARLIAFESQFPAIQDLLQHQHLVPVLWVSRELIGQTEYLCLLTPLAVCSLRDVGQHPIIHKRLLFHRLIKSVTRGICHLHDRNTCHNRINMDKILFYIDSLVRNFQHAFLLNVLFIF